MKEVEVLGFRVYLRSEVKKVQVAVLVAIQQLRSARVQLEPIDFGVMVDSCEHMSARKVQHLDACKQDI